MSLGFGAWEEAGACEGGLSVWGRGGGLGRPKDLERSVVEDLVQLQV